MLTLLPPGFCCRRQSAGGQKRSILWGHVCPWAGAQVAERAAGAFPEALQSDWRHRRCQASGSWCRSAMGSCLREVWLETCAVTVSPAPARARSFILALGPWLPQLHGAASTGWTGWDKARQCLCLCQALPDTFPL